VPSDNEFEQEAENFAIERGGRSGRIAKQFAIYKMISSQEI
jgi:predicted AAA+ superfamily ATPase